MSAYRLRILDGVTQRTLLSSSATVDFAAIKIGASALELKETGGHFDFSAKKLVNLADATSAGEAATKGQMDTALALKEDVASKGAANGYAPLGADSKIPSNFLPAVAITDTFVVANEAAMLALTAEVGDVAVRTDISKTFILRLAGASTLSNWQEILQPGAPVLSVNGQTGSVSLDSDDIGEGSTNLYYTVARAALKQDVLTAGPGIKIVGATISTDIEKSFQNDNAGSLNAGQIAYIKSNGHIDLAKADNSALSDELELVVVNESIASTATGKCIVKDGEIIGGFSGLTPGKHVYVDKSTAGALTQDVSGYTTGDCVYSVGKAISATEIKYKPVFLYQL